MSDVPTTATTEGLGDQAEYEEAFERTGHGKFNHLATCACSLIFIHSIIEMLAIAFIITPAACDLNLSVGEMSMVNSSVFVGIMLTAMAWGVIGDLYGRRRIMLPGVLCTIASSLVSSFSNGFWMMLIGRFLVGIMVSASSAMVLVYLAELQPDKHRDPSISIAISAAQLSFVIIPGIAWIIIPRKALTVGSISFQPWRLFMWLWSFVGFVGAVILFILPESPRYIISVKGPNAAQPILAKIFAMNSKKKASEFPVKTITMRTEFRAEGPSHLLKDLSQMMKVPIRRCVVLTHTAMFVAFMLAHGVYIWLPDFINAAIPRAGDAINMCIILNDKYIKYSGSHPWSAIEESESGLSGGYDCSKTVNVNWMVYPMAMGTELFYLIPFFLTHILMVKHYNNVKLFAITMSSCAVGLLLCVAVPQSMIALMCLILGLACNTACTLLTALAVDAFPTSLRGLATCTMYMVGQLGAVVGTSLISLMIDWYCYVIYFLLALSSAGKIRYIYLIVFFAASGLSLIFFWPNVQDVRKIMEGKNFSY